MFLKKKAGTYSWIQDDKGLTLCCCIHRSNHRRYYERNKSLFKGLFIFFFFVKGRGEAVMFVFLFQMYFWQVFFNHTSARALLPLCVIFFFFQDWNQSKCSRFDWEIHWKMWNDEGKKNLFFFFFAKGECLCVACCVCLECGCCVHCQDCLLDFQFFFFFKKENVRVCGMEFVAMCVCAWSMLLLCVWSVLLCVVVVLLVQKKISPFVFVFFFFFRTS